MHAVILAGGIGKRLWPLSTQLNPKPFLNFNNDLSLIQNTLLRVSKVISIKNIIISTSRSCSKKIIEHCNKLNISSQIEILLEEESQDTTISIATAATYIKNKYGKNEGIYFMPCDHIIKKENNFCESMSSAQVLLQQNKIALFGIKPTYAEKNYGYIKYEEQKVVNFIEKPSASLAAKFIASGKYLWNSGIICCKAKVMLDEIDRYNKGLLKNVENSLNTAIMSLDGKYKQIFCRKIMTTMQHVSIDYSTLQKSKNIAVLSCDIGWNDVGNWQQASQILPSDKNGNNIQGAVKMHDTSNCYIASNSKKIIAVGVKDLVILEKEGEILIMNKKDAAGFKSKYSQFSN